MPIQFNLLSVFPLLSAAVQLVLIALVLRMRRTLASTLLVAEMLFVAVWATAYGLNIASWDLGFKTVMFKLGTLGACGTEVTLLLFVICFVGLEEWLTRTRVILLALVPGLNFLFSLALEHHRLHAHGFSVKPLGGAWVLGFKPGLFFLLNLVFVLGMIVTILVLLTRAVRRNRGPFRSQALMLLAGVLGPFGAAVAFMSDHRVLGGFDPTTSLAWITSLFNYLSLRKFGLLDLVPVARGAVLEALKDAVLIFDDRNRLVEMNAAAASLLGLDPAEALGRDVAGLLSGRICLERAVAGAGAAEAEYFCDLDGRAWHVIVRSFRYARGEVEGRLVVLHDVTELRESERNAREYAARLRESEDHFRRLVEVSPDGIILLAADGRLTYASARAAQMFLVSPGDAAGRPALEYLVGEDRETAHERLKTLFEGNRPTLPRVFRVRRADGTTFWAEFKSTPIADAHGNVTEAMTVIRDVTEQKRFEEALEQSERMFRRMIERSPVAIALIEAGERIEYLNERFIEDFGYRREEVPALSDLWLRAIPNEDARALVEAAWGRVRDTSADGEEGGHSGQKPGPLELNFVCRDGSRRSVELVWSRVTDRVLAHFNDVTEHKRIQAALNEMNAELARRVEEETEHRLRQERLLAQQARLAAMGDMVGAIAHQWRQPLATLGIIIENIRVAWSREMLTEAFLDKAVADARMQVFHMSDTIEEFRNFFRPEKSQEEFDVGGKVGEVLRLIGAQFESNGIAVRVELPEGVPIVVTGYPNEFKQVLLNLLTNARDAILERRDRDGEMPGDPGDDAVSICLAEGAEWVRIEVEDTGCGISPSAADRVFDPYYTTKDPGKGTGIGLYMSRMIVETSMGGRLSFRGKARGTVFRVELPRGEDGREPGQG